MRGTPAVTTLQSRAGVRPDDSLYVFVRGDSGRLYTRYWDGSLRRWLWADLGQPPTARVNSSPGVLAPGGTTDRASALHAFVRGNDGRLYERHWNGSRWLDWIDHGKPNVASIGMTPAVHGLFDAAVRSRVFVFCWAGDATGSFLFHYRRNLREWRFSGSTETGADIVSEPAAFPDWSISDQVLTAYAIGNDGHLHRFLAPFEPAQPSMQRDLGAPTAQGLAWLRPSVVGLPLTDPSPTRIFAFATGDDGRLWAHEGGAADQTMGTWMALEPPQDTTNTTVASGPSAVGFHFEDREFLYAFVQGANGHLLVLRWDGDRLDDGAWADLGRPTTNGANVPAAAQGGTTNVVSPPAATTFTLMEHSGPSHRMYAFVLGADAHLHVCYWNGRDAWLWTDLAVPRFIGVAPEPLDFGPLAVGNVQTRTIQIANHSETTPVTVSFPGSSTGSFRWDAFNAQIAAGQSRTVTIEFSPTQTGSLSSALTIVSDTPDSPHRVDIRGRGIGIAPVRADDDADEDDATRRTGADALRVGSAGGREVS